MALPQALGPQSQSGVTPITAPAPPASLQYRLSGGTYEKDQHNPCGIRAVGYVVLRAGTKIKERCAGVQSGTQTFSGIVQEAKEYQCPVSGTIGSHVSVKGGPEVIEVHLAPAT